MVRGRKKTAAELTQSGRLISIRTSVALESLLARYITEVSRTELNELDRAEAARRLLTKALTEWEGTRETKKKTTKKTKPEKA